MINKNSSYAGYEAWSHNLKTSIKMNLLILLVITLAYAGTIAYISYDKTEANEAYFMLKWLHAWVVYKNFPNWGIRLDNGEIYSATVIYNHYYDFCIEKLLIYKSIALSSLWIYLSIIPIKLYFRKKAKVNTEDKFSRGSKKLTSSEQSKQMRRDKKYFNFGQVKMPIEAETKHSLVIGRTGCGKTALIAPIIDQMRKRGNRAVIYDYKGDFVSKFYDDKKDMIFNPLDIRSMDWNIFDDISNPMDINAMVASLIPEMPNSSQPFFNMAARDLLKGILHYLYQNNMRSTEALWHTLTKSPEEIYELIKDIKGAEAGATHIADTSNKQTASVISTMLLYTKTFEYSNGFYPTFSISDWMKNGEGFLFVSNYSDLKDTLRPILSLFIDTIGKQLLALPEDRKRRLFFIIDELGTLQKLNTLIELLTLSRSKGGSVFLGIQDIGQIDSIYGKELRGSIVNNCATNAIFGVSDPDTAEFLSRKIGETEYTTNTGGITIGSSSDRTAVSYNESVRREPLMLPSELMNQPDLSCFVKFPNYQGCLTKLKYKSFPDNHKSFVIRKELKLDNIMWEQQKIADELNLSKSSKQKTQKLEKF